ncbi:MAG TPA: AI-2E family transporter [Stellaceae bacterium]|nr:AI-2E family transporter [Stellaceae bacterium]
MPNSLHSLESESASPSQVAPAGTPGLRGLVGIVAAAIAVAALYFGREVLIPVTLAMLLSFVLSPLVELLRRIWLGRILSVVLAVVLALGLILALGSAIGTQVAQLSGNLPQYQTTIETKIAGLRNATINKFSQKLGSFGHQLSGPAPRSEAPAPASTGAPAQGPQQKPVPVVITQPAPSVVEFGKNFLEPMLYPVATAGIILIVTIFTLLQKEDLRDRAIRLLGSGDLHRTTVAMDEAGRRLSRYFLTQLGINASFGVIVGVGLYFIGVPNPLLWGILGALLRFVPYIGSWIAAALPIVLAAAVEPGWSMAIWTAVLYAVTELIMGQAIEPLVYGHSTGLSPVAVIIAAIFWTWIWGPIGLIISTPLTLCLVVLGRHIERLEFFDVLLGDRPALTPTEGLYQRMLAGDPDEAEEQAERYLADRPLSSYYDEVVLEALRLAANDMQRGTLEAQQLEQFIAAMDELIHDLGERTDLPSETPETEKTAAADRQALPSVPAAGEEVGDDRLAPEWRTETPVLCIAGRGALDELAARMLAQLLGKYGLKVRIVPHEAVSRTRIAALDVAGIAMICVSFISAGGGAARLRYLLRRLRERQPASRLLLGLWPASDANLVDGDLRRTLGADFYVTSLREAVRTCLAEANLAPRPQMRLVPAAHAYSGESRPPLPT